MEDVKLKPWELREPRNLAGLIDIYESNYFRLMRLVPDLETLDGTVVSRVAGASTPTAASVHCCESESLCAVTCTSFSVRDVKFSEFCSLNV